jgi:hypothetical protein
MTLVCRASNRGIVLPDRMPICSIKFHSFDKTCALFNRRASIATTMYLIPIFQVENLLKTVRILRLTTGQVFNANNCPKKFLLASGKQSCDTHTCHCISDSVSIILMLFCMHNIISHLFVCCFAYIM